MACFNVLPLLVRYLREDHPPENEVSEENENLLDTNEIKDLIREHLTLNENIRQDVSNEIDDSTKDLERLVKIGGDQDDMMRCLKKILRLKAKKNMIINIISKLDALDDSMDTQKISHEFSGFYKKLQGKLNLSPDKVQKKSDENENTVERLNTVLSEIDSMVHNSTHMELNNQVEEGKCEELFQEMFGRRIEDRTQEVPYLPTKHKPITSIKVPKENSQTTDPTPKKDRQAAKLPI